MTEGFQKQNSNLHTTLKINLAIPSQPHKHIYTYQSPLTHAQQIRKVIQTQKLTTGSPH
jgi:hypothetical protein